MQFARHKFWCVAVISGPDRSGPSRAAEHASVLDDCSDAARWEAVTSDGVKLKYSVETAC